MMEAVSTSETAVIFSQSTRCSIPENRHLCCKLISLAYGMNDYGVAEGRVRQVVLSSCIPWPWLTD
jgi:hypothetical protein